MNLLTFWLGALSSVPLWVSFFLSNAAFSTNWFLKFIINFIAWLKKIFNFIFELFCDIEWSCCDSTLFKVQVPSMFTIKRSDIIISGCKRLSQRLVVSELPVFAYMLSNESIFFVKIKTSHAVLLAWVNQWATQALSILKLCDIPSTIVSYPKCLLLVEGLKVFLNCKSNKSKSIKIL